MLNAFKNHINDHFSDLFGAKLLIANSGGVDSMVLTYLSMKIGLDITLAHCNFKLRGRESDEDERFVKQTADNWGLTLFSKSFDTKDYAQKHRLSTQVAARDLRYHWFNELLKDNDMDYILTAHHADDDLETFFINLSRGTGIDGLTGIPEINNNIVRPLLNFTREEIEVFAIDNALKWRDDSTNASTVYLRNKLRHDVIPALKNMNPQLLQNFKKTQKQLLEAKHILEDRINEVKKEIIVEDKDGVVVYSIKSILNLNNPKYYIYQLFKEYNFNEYNDIYELLNAQSGKFVTSEKHRLLKDRDTLILSEIKFESQDNITIEMNDNEVVFPMGKLSIALVNEIKQNVKKSIFIDKDNIKFPLKLRKWRQGDYFYPLGLGGKKKLSKYFKDEKYSLLDKENAWLLCSQDRIVWVLPNRMDERFKVTENTKQIMHIEYVEG